jgi:hypothetical protein
LFDTYRLIFYIRPSLGKRSAKMLRLLKSLLPKLSPLSQAQMFLPLLYKLLLGSTNLTLLSASVIILTLPGKGKKIIPTTAFTGITFRLSFSQ